MCFFRFCQMLCAVTLLGACSESSGLGRGDAVPPPSRAPLGDETVQEQELKPAAAKSETEAKTTERSKEQRQSDAEACYSYARANVRNEARLDNDIEAGRGSRNSQVARYSVLTKPVNNYYYQKQEQRLFESCMRQKGYSKE